jgi:hypothetical protein
MKTLVLLAAVATMFSAKPDSGELVGPARFCGYSPIIDLLPGERVLTLEGGIHGGRFRWDGSFGSLDVFGTGWASRPPGRISRPQTDTRPARFAQRREDDRYVVAIWNGEHGAAYFSSDKPLTLRQTRAISRVTLYQEGETPSGCDLQTVFVWE